MNRPKTVEQILEWKERESGNQNILAYTHTYSGKSTSNKGENKKYKDNRIKLLPTISKGICFCLLTLVGANLKVCY